MIDTPTLASLTQRLKQIQTWKTEKEELEQQVSKLGEDIKKESFACAKILIENQTRSIVVEELGRCQYAQTNYFNVKDRDALHQFLRENQAESLIKETVHGQSLKAYCKERLEQNLPLPTGVETYTEEYVKIIKEGNHVKK